MQVRPFFFWVMHSTCHLLISTTVAPGSNVQYLKSAPSLERALIMTWLCSLGIMSLTKWQTTGSSVFLGGQNAEMRTANLVPSHSLCMIQMNVLRCKPNHLTVKKHGFGFWGWCEGALGTGTLLLADLYQPDVVQKVNETIMVNWETKNSKLKYNL